MYITTYGQSECARPLQAVVFGDPSRERHILFQAAIHAREHITARLLEALYPEFSLAASRHQVCIHLLSMTNPDGARISQGLASPLIQGDFPMNSPKGFTTWKANALGVDLNRNFPAGWEALGGPEFPGPERYKGSRPLCARESRALADYTRSYPFAATVSYHASGSVIFWEYGDKREVNDRSRALAEEVGRATGYSLAGFAGLEAGGYKDWAMDALGIPSITVEVGEGEAPLAEAEFSEIFMQNRDVSEAVCRWVSRSQPPGAVR